MAVRALARVTARLLRPAFDFVWPPLSRERERELARTLPSDDEFRERLSAALDEQRALQRKKYLDYSRQRLSYHIDSTATDGGSRSREEDKRIGGLEPELFHGYHLLLILVPLLVAAAVLQRVKVPESFSAQLTNKNVLNARLTMLEEKLGVNAKAVVAPNSADDPDTAAFAQSVQRALIGSREQSVNQQVMDAIRAQAKSVETPREPHENVSAAIAAMRERIDALERQLASTSGVREPPCETHTQRAAADGAATEAPPVP